jgi:hypothetical protein
MAQRVPEVALVLGAFLGLVVLGTGLLFTGDATTTTLVALAVSLPLFGYAVRHSEDPTTALPPPTVLKGGLGLAGVALVALLGLSTGAAESLPLAFFLALFVALVVALTSTAYYVQYGRRRYGFPPGKVAVLTTFTALALLAFALLVAETLYAGSERVTTLVAVAALDALLIFLAGGVYAVSRGLRPRPAAARLLVGGGALFGVAVAAVGVAVGSLGPWVVAGGTVILGPAVLAALARR